MITMHVESFLMLKLGSENDYFEVVNMELRVLRYFVTIVQEGNISGAANVLHVSQSTLSRQIQDLESELATTLFTRGSRRIKLTADGQFLYSRAEEMLQLADSTRHAINAQDIVSGDLIIGAGENFTSALIAQIFRQIVTAYPKAKVHLVSTTGDDVRAGIDKGTLDFGIITTEADFPEYAQLQFPQKDAWGLVMPAKHELTQKKALEPVDLAGHRILLARQADVERTLRQWVGAYQSQVQIVGTYDMYYSMHVLVRNRVGLAFSFDKPDYHQPDSQLVFRPLAQMKRFSSKLIWKHGRPSSRLAEIFLTKMNNAINNGRH
ncbi:transcriptional regulator, LysR family [Levilactobacillus brevis ATCC 14869 = DSM 20054]|uniref:Transcriptional regulator, LysR family n=2 Tax=Levilactobacillus brevis TaxID=1580 RepID=U2P5M4_LEVBR|nr:transcriptional regulator, LysR family [Levilactobacillus brevis ATCC 14869 = DSM 20054]